MHCHKAGLGLGQELEILELRLARNLKVLDWDSTRNGVHWNWN